MASERIQVLTDDNFEQTVNQPTPVLVDFWAEWCPPCRALAPTVDELAGDYDGRVVVAKMNTDENPETPTRFSVRGIPTLLLFKDGQVVEQVVGLADKASLKRLITATSERSVQPTRPGVVSGTGCGHGSSSQSDSRAEVFQSAALTRVDRGRTEACYGQMDCPGGWNCLRLGHDQRVAGHRALQTDTRDVVRLEPGNRIWGRWTAR